MLIKEGNERYLISLDDFQGPKNLTLKVFNIKTIWFWGHRGIQFEKFRSLHISNLHFKTLESGRAGILFSTNEKYQHWFFQHFLNLHTWCSFPFSGRPRGVEATKSTLHWRYEWPTFIFRTQASRHLKHKILWGGF